MEQTLAILGQEDLAATTLTDTYEVPPATQAAIAAVVFCNRNGAARTIRLSVAKGGAADDPKQYLSYGKTIDPNDSLQFGPFSLGAGDVIRAWASAIDVSVNVFGAEEA